MALLIDQADGLNLTNQIFSILENRFLFGYENHDNQPQHMKCEKHAHGKVGILSIDSGTFSHAVLAAHSLLHLQTFLRQKSGDPNAHIAHYVDVIAGSGAGGILAALLSTRGKNGAPLFTAEEALNFLINNRRKLFPSSSSSQRQGLLRRIFCPAVSSSKSSSRSKVEKLLTKTFGELTLKDTLKPVLMPCYDLSTHAPLLFSRADALEMDAYDFKMKDVCTATLADPMVVGAVEMRSVDGSTKIIGVEGGVAMSNPTAAAITHVLNNKQEFPFCNGVEDLLVLSLGNGHGESALECSDAKNTPQSVFLRLAGQGVSDMVDQAVAMAFAESENGKGKGKGKSSNYVRIQGNPNSTCKIETEGEGELRSMTAEMLAERNVEAVLFKGKKRSDATNLEKMEMMGSELLKEQQRRKTSILPTVLLKEISVSPRMSSASASTISTQSSSSCSI